jgi:tRNA dimethylallyltransferase
MRLDLPDIPPDRPVLIAGPTASGKSALALQIAQEQGGTVINADASQVYGCWRVVTARPTLQDETMVPHRLYGHVSYDTPYSAGHWLREVNPLLSGSERPIIVGGTGLYFTALTRGMADIPPTPDDIRALGDEMPLSDLLAGLDPEAVETLDLNNRARVQRAWEVLQTTGRSLMDWQADTPPPVLQESACCTLVMDTDKQWLEQRINRRFDQMLEQGALEEVKAMRHLADASLPAFRAIGVPDLLAYLDKDISLDTARSRATIATRQFAKRQRTWFRSKMQHWIKIRPHLNGTIA